jgi:hypothetical protein
MTFLFVLLGIASLKRITSHLSVLINTFTTDLHLYIFDEKAERINFSANYIYSLFFQCIC